MDPTRFAGTVRYRDRAKGRGLAVVDIPTESSVAASSTAASHVPAPRISVFGLVMRPPSNAVAIMTVHLPAISNHSDPSLDE
jgi:hypothetical protein